MRALVLIGGLAVLLGGCPTPTTPNAGDAGGSADAQPGDSGNQTPPRPADVNGDSQSTAPPAGGLIAPIPAQNPGDGSPGNPDAGSGTNPPNDTPPPSGGDALSISGRYTGDLNRVETGKIISDTGVLPSVRDDVTFLDIEFDPSRLPIALSLPSFLSVFPDLSLDLRQAGETVTKSGTGSSGDYTVTVTVREAAYTDTTARVVLDITLSTSGGAVTYDGSGVQTIQANIGSDGLTYTSLTEYDVRTNVALINRIMQIFDDQGVLPRQ